MIEQKSVPIEETKLYQQFMNQPENERSFRKILKERKLSETSQDLIIYGLCLSSTSDISDPYVAIGRLQKYINSAGKYGSSPFILCRYGFGDIAQGFARSASIVGTIFLCNHSFNTITKNEELNEFNIACQSPSFRNDPVPFTVRCKNIIKSSFFESNQNETKRIDYLQFFTPNELEYSRKSYISLPNIASQAIQSIIMTDDRMTTISLCVEHNENDKENVLEIALSKIVPNYEEIGVFMVKYSLNLNQSKSFKTSENGIVITSDGTIGINADVDLSVKEAESICGEKLFKDDEIVGQVTEEDLNRINQ